MQIAADSVDRSRALGVVAEHAMVATGQPLAARAAAQILHAGGSAVDAAIAADAVMGVVEPMATSIGGDLLAMVVQPDGVAVTYNGTGRAPAALDPAALEGFPGRRIPERHSLSLTVPGAVQGWHDLHARYGNLSFAQVLAPAIRVARSGFAIAPVCAREWALFDHVLQEDPECAKLYRAGNPPQAGDHFCNEALADVLESIATGGPHAFYQGPPARAAAQASAARGGVLDADDFAAHRGNFDTPLATTFRGLTVLECPPNTHGIAVLHALAELEPKDLQQDDPRTMVAAARAMARGLARAKEVVADPSGNTVCTVAVDRSGLAITLMSSIFKRFGSGIAVPGCGFVLQNRGFGFASPGHVNGAAPRRRPYHTVVPAAALREGRFHAAFGVVGGAMQPQGHVQLLIRLAAWKQSLQLAIDAPRWRLESESALAVEAGMPAQITKALRDAGFSEPASSGELGGRSDFGGAQVVMRTDEGWLAGGSDRRKDGMALGI
jgi:gamma-glutamyltranspeptidase/glutathione hydrolase